MSREGRLWFVFALNVLFVGVLAVVGLGAHSISVLAEGVDYFADAAAIALTIWAIRLSRRPTTVQHPKRHSNATSWAALVNAAWLLVLVVGVSIQAILRLVQGVSVVHGAPVLIVSAAAALTMVVGVVILGGDADELDEGQTLSMRAVFLDTAADATAAGAVAATGAIIILTHAYWLDPAVALLVSLIVGYQAMVLLKKIKANFRPPVSPVSSDSCDA